MSQPQKRQILNNFVYKKHSSGKSHRNREQKGGFQGLEEGGMGSYSLIGRVSIREGEALLAMDDGGSCTTM